MASRAATLTFSRLTHRLTAHRSTTATSSAAFRSFSAEAAPEAAPQDEKIPLATPQREYTPKITALVDQIAALNLLEVSDLNALLKERLNISDAPVMMAGMGGAPAAAAAPEEEEEEEAPAAIQTAFTIKLKEFDTAKKVALIKELKAQVEGMNLVQAKKFVESAPAVVKADVSKDEAEALKKALEAAGAVCEIE